MKYKTIKDDAIAMGTAEIMVDMVDDEQHGPKEILKDVHKGCKVCLIKKYVDFHV